VRSRPLPVTVAAILLVLLSLTEFPFLWWFFFPGMEAPPAFVLYSDIVVGVVGLLVAVGLWIIRTWSLRATLISCVLNLLLGAPGVVMAPTARVRVTVSATEVVAAFIIALVMFPSSRRALEPSTNLTRQVNRVSQSEELLVE